MAGERFAPSWALPVEFPAAVLVVLPCTLAASHGRRDQSSRLLGCWLITPTDWATWADIRGGDIPGVDIPGVDIRGGDIPGVDIRDVADACHEWDVPRIVDETRGAQPPFHEDLLSWGLGQENQLRVLVDTLAGLPTRVATPARGIGRLPGPE